MLPCPTIKNCTVLVWHTNRNNNYIDEAALSVPVDVTHIDEARPKNGLGKRIQEPNIRANVEKASEMGDNRDTEHR